MLSLIKNIIESRGFFLLDGGLATEMEAHGLDLNHPLWSAYHIHKNPEVIKEVHRSFFAAGADCIATVSYQASFEGGRAHGMTDKEIEQWLRTSVDLACEARDEFSQNLTSLTGYERLVAASIGPYGAFLADGGEYRGDYVISGDQLYDFHARRWQIMADSKADILACETIPSYAEAQVLAKLFSEVPHKEGYISFTCRDEQHISDGTPLSECVGLLDGVNNIIAIGVNCMAVSRASVLVKTIKSVQSDLEIAVYPNSGEKFDPVSKEWYGQREIQDFAEAAAEWYRLGARIIGGCCRTTPEHIRGINARMLE